MDNNIAAVLAAALVSLQNVVAVLREGRIVTLLTFSGWADEDIWKFIRQLEIVFLANQIIDNRKFNIAISCLTGMMANWYKLNWRTLANWNTVGQPNNIQFRTSIIERFDTAVQWTSYYNQYLNLKQTPHQSVDEYINRFTEFRMKVDRNNTIPVE